MCPSVLSVVPRLACLLTFLASFGCVDDDPFGTIDVPREYSNAEEPAGQNCAFGGLAFSSGRDSDGNGSLDADEVERIQYVCKDTTSTLLVAASEPSGANCAAGGTKLTSGNDDNHNGTLDENEIDATRYVCDAETAT